MKKNVESRQVTGTSSAGKTFLMMAIVTIASFLFLEIGARVIFGTIAGRSALLYGTNWQNTPPRSVKDHTKEELGYTKYFPNERKVDYDPLSEGHDAFEVTINSHGFRGEDFKRDKDRGTIRIVTLGASSTFGYYNRDHETYPYQLEELLNAKADGSLRFEVINLGVPHLRAAQIQALFELEALPLKPDIVTFYEGFNDSVRPWGEAGRQSFFLANGDGDSGSLKAAYIFARDHFISVSLIDELITNSNFATYNYDDFVKHREGRSEIFLDSLTAIREGLEERGVPFIIIKQQAKSVYSVKERVEGITYEEEYDLVHKKLMRDDSITWHEIAFLTHKSITDGVEVWAIENGVPFIDAIELLDNDRHVLVSVVHLSPEGNRMIAGALAEEIDRQLAKSRVERPGT